jgi:carboxypeptidase PM20D1
LFAVASFRAISLFDDLQVTPAVGITAIDVDEAAAVQHFSEALRIPTISHDDRSNFDAQAFLDFHAFLQQSYPLIHQQTTRTVVNNYSLVYHLKGVEPGLEPVLFMSHMDVVPVEDITLDEWTYPAFSGTVADGVIWGRGAIDVKIGVVALMEALELLLSENTRPERDIYFAFGHDEEVGGTDGAAMVARHFEERGPWRLSVSQRRVAPISP